MNYENLIKCYDEYMTILREQTRKKSGYLNFLKIKQYKANALYKKVFEDDNFNANTTNYEPFKVASDYNKFVSMVRIFKRQFTELLEKYDISETLFNEYYHLYCEMVKLDINGVIDFLKIFTKMLENKKEERYNNVINDINDVIASKISILKKCNIIVEKCLQNSINIDTVINSIQDNELRTILIIIKKEVKTNV